MFRLLCFFVFSLAAAIGALTSDIEYGKAGGVSLTLDAHVPDGRGPFPAVIMVHGGSFNKGDKQTYVQPLFQPLTDAGFAWFTINLSADTIL